jgi:hypothetical protein
LWSYKAETEDTRQQAAGDSTALWTNAEVRSDIANYFNLQLPKQIAPPMP